MNLEQRMEGLEAEIALSVRKLDALRADYAFEAEAKRPDFDRGPERILVAVAKRNNLRPSYLVGRSQEARIVAVRHLAMRMARERGYSYPRIGRAFNRHHTTVMGACRSAA